MERPTSVRIGGFDFAVCWMPAEWSADTGHSGEISYVKHEIRIKETLRPDELAAVFAHEVMHGVWWYYSYGERRDNIEAIADCAGYGMLDFWKSNPDVFRWWVSLVQD